RAADGERAAEATRAAEVPDEDPPVERRAIERAAVVAERENGHGSGVAGQRLRRRRIVDMPHDRAVVLAGCHRRAPIGAERRGDDRTGVTAGAGSYVTGAEIEEPDRTVPFAEQERP